MPTAITPSKKQIKETAIRLWKNDFPSVPIQVGSTEWQLYMVKAEEIEKTPTVIDNSANDDLYTALKKVLKTDSTLEKAWTVILEHRAKFVELAKANKGILETFRFLPESINDYCYDHNGDGEGCSFWDEEGDFTDAGEMNFQFLRQFLCIDDIGIGSNWDGYVN